MRPRGHAGDEKAGVGVSIMKTKGSVLASKELNRVPMWAIGSLAALLAVATPGFAQHGGRGGGHGGGGGGRRSGGFGGRRAAGGLGGGFGGDAGGFAGGPPAGAFGGGRPAGSF